MKSSFTFSYQEEYIPPRCRKPRIREVSSCHEVQIKELSEKDTTLAALEAVASDPDFFQEFESDNSQKDKLDAILNGKESDTRVKIIKWRFFDGNFYVERNLVPNYAGRVYIRFIDREEHEEKSFLKAYHSRDITSPTQVIQRCWPNSCPSISYNSSLADAKRTLDNWAARRIIVDGTPYVKVNSEPVYLLETYTTYRHGEGINKHVYAFTLGDHLGEDGRFYYKERKYFYEIANSGSNLIQGHLDHIKYRVEKTFWNSRFKVIDPSLFSYSQEETIANWEAAQKEERYKSISSFLYEKAKTKDEAHAFIKQLYLDIDKGETDSTEQH